MWTGVILGTLGTLTCEGWPAVWIILELNIISFITLFSSKWSAKKRCIVYFIVQRVGSLIILRRGVMSDRRKIATWIILGIALKARIAPLHFWGGIIITRLTSSTAFIFLTWQKIAPAFLLFVTRPKSILNGLILINVVIAATRGMGAKSLWFLLFFSGLIHIGWLLSAPLSCAILYILLYILSTLPVFLTGGSINLAILIMNLGGLPPITGFFMKLIILPTISLGFGIILMAFSAILLFAYIRAFMYNSTQKGRIKIMTLCACSMGLIF